MIEIIKFEMVRKGALIARFNLKMHKWGGLLIKECSYFESGDKKWINLPSRQYEVEGKKKYASYICYEDRDLDDKFKASIMKSVEEYIVKLSSTQEKIPVAEDEFPF